MAARAPSGEAQSARHGSWLRYSPPALRVGRCSPGATSGGTWRRHQADPALRLLVDLTPRPLALSRAEQVCSLEQRRDARVTLQDSLVLRIAMAHEAGEHLICAS